MANSTVDDTLVTETPILIIGASMIGMTLSALLAKQHLSGCITVEKHASTAIHPRAALFHPRTMQIYNELGLYHHMRDESLKHYDEHAGIYNVESLAGKHLSTYMDDLNQGLDRISPFPRLYLTQQTFEPLLKDCATSYGADLRFSTEMVEFEQDDDGVTALIRDTNTGQTEKIRAKYMVAADGSRSKVREKLGIQVKGHGRLSDSITIYFKANLGPFIEGKYNGVIYVNNGRVRGFFRLNKSGDEGFLVVSTYGDKHNDESRFPSVGITDAKAAEILRAAIGADVPFEITHLAPWTARCDVARSLNVGRVLLAGDAAHVNTPHGGFGGNTGIQDAHNLAWKLAKVLQGKGGRDLVEKTYNAERQPVCEKTVNQVFAKYLARTDPELPLSARWQTEVQLKHLNLEDEAPETWLELGYRYQSQNMPNISLDNVLEDPATAKAVPGSLARHVHITTHDRNKTSFALAELLGQDFVLIIGENGTNWTSVLNSGPLVEFRNIVKSYILEPNQNWPFYNKYAILPTGCVLIRPDAVVVWSTSELPTEKGFTAFGLPSGSQVLRGALRQALCYDSKKV